MPKRKRKSYSKKAGLPPGSLIYVGKERTHTVILKEIIYSRSSYSDKVLEDVESLDLDGPEESVNWLMVDGVYNTNLIEKIGSIFGLDKLVLEDILNTQSRPKIEEYDDYIFATLRVLGNQSENNMHSDDQLSLVMGKNWIISFYEIKNTMLDPFIDRIRQAKGIIRQRKSDYIFYRIIDTVVDHYFLLTESLSEELDHLEEAILENHENVDATQIYQLKKKIGSLKKSILPARQLVYALIKSEHDLIDNSTIPFLRDVYEHIIQVMDAIDAQRETINDILNLYMSVISNKMNQVMKVLTIFASIFIPLTFIAGIYGMNFEIMPELKWKYGYFITWGVMLLVTIALLIFFKRKKWL